MDYVIMAIMVFAAYLLGSIPFGLVIGKMNGVDIRTVGSKNIGSTNAIRILGKKKGFIAFGLDVFKGALPILIVYLLHFTHVWEVPNEITLHGKPLFILFGIPAVIGHVFPVYLKFKGGKAVATSLGVVFALTPVTALLCLVAFGLTIKITGYSSLGSTFATFTVLLSVWFLEPYIVHIDLVSQILYSCLGVLIIVKHRKNYVRLLKGTENSFKKKKEAMNEKNNSTEN